jgi:hypothetical protein
MATNIGDVVPYAYYRVTDSTYPVVNGEYTDR